MISSSTTGGPLSLQFKASPAHVVGGGNPFRWDCRGFLLLASANLVVRSCNETLEHLAAAGTRVCRTDLDGAMTFYVDGRSVTPTSTGLR